MPLRKRDPKQFLAKPPDGNIAAPHIEISAKTRAKISATTFPAPIPLFNLAIESEHQGSQ